MNHRPPPPHNGALAKRADRWQSHRPGSAVGYAADGNSTARRGAHSMNLDNLAVLHDLPKGAVIALHPFSLIQHRGFTYVVAHYLAVCAGDWIFYFFFTFLFFLVFFPGWE